MAKSKTIKPRAMLNVEHRLNEWATWRIKKQQHGLGFKEKSIEHRIRQGDAFLQPSSSVKKNLPFNVAAEEIEVLINEIAQINPFMKNVLIIHYLTRGNLREKAKHLQCSATAFKYYVDMAQWWLMARLHASR